ncbi:uncharacterized protein LOC102806973, partial [Saccoglossus kowalevskii]
FHNKHHECEVTEPVQSTVHPPQPPPPPQSTDMSTVIVTIPTQEDIITDSSLRTRLQVANENVLHQHYQLRGMMPDADTYLNMSKVYAVDGAISEVNIDNERSRIVKDIALLQQLDQLLVYEKSRRSYDKMLNTGKEKDAVKDDSQVECEEKCLEETPTLTLGKVIKTENIDDM